MPRIPHLFLVLVAAFLLFSQSATAWHRKGHMAVAAVAYDLLSEPAKDRVEKLLALNPASGEWNNRIATAKNKDTRKLRFMLAAMWPDDIKSDPLYTKEDESDPRAGRNIGYPDDKLQHRYWHYVDYPFTQDKSSLAKAAVPAINAEERIILFRKTLASNASENVKSYDLVWLIHLVGDVHQPLHCTARVSKGHPRGDAGGNLHKLTAACKFCPTELHGFWDGAIGEAKSVDAVAAYAGALAAADPTAAGNLDTHAWTQDSFTLAQTQVYIAPIKPGFGPSTLDDDYRDNARKVAEPQVALAGARLARIINTELK